MSEACRCAGSARLRPVTGMGSDAPGLYSPPRRIEPPGRSAMDCRPAAVEMMEKQMTEPFRSHKVQFLAPGGLHRMAYLEWGDAGNPRVLICVHGLARCARDFDFLARELSAHYRVVCPDAPGRGESD